MESSGGQTLSKIVAQFRVLFSDTNTVASGRRISPEIKEPPLNPRVLVLRNNRNGRKILFDSEYVTDEGNYIPQKDTKFLKEILAEFVFGAICLSNNNTVRFTQLQGLYCWAKLVDIAHRSKPSTPNKRQDLLSVPPSSSPPNTAQSSSSNNSSSSSGYSSSLPNFNQSHHHQNYNSSHLLLLQHTNSLPSSLLQSNSTLIGLALLLPNYKPLLQLSPTIFEPTLTTLSCLIKKSYNSRSFPQTLKSFSNSLTLDINNYNLLLPKPLSNPQKLMTLLSQKILPDFLTMVLQNPDSKIVIVTNGRQLDLAEAFIQLCHLINQKNNKSTMTKTDNENNKKGGGEEDYFDSGIGFKCDSICDTQSCHSHNSFNSNYSDNLCDIYSEEEDSSENDGIKSNKNKKKGGGFYLGDNLNDEQTEENLALGSPDKSKLLRDPPQIPQQQQQQTKTEEENVPQINLPPRIIPLEIDYEEGKEICPLPPLYHLNPTNRFSPFTNYQLLLLKQAPLSYDYMHTTNYSIIELNLDKSTLKGINLSAIDTPDPRLKSRISTLVTKTKELFSIVKDYDKVEGFFLIHLNEECQ